MVYRYDYHQDADILEIFFQDVEATASVQLTPDIILHFRAEDSQAVSLIFNNFSAFIHRGEYGPQAFHLLIERWPETLRATVWQILASPPVSDWLTISTYRSPRMRHAIPLAALRATPPLSIGSAQPFVVNN